MATTKHTGAQATLGALAEGALTDIEKLIGQHFALFRSEMKEELEDARAAALSLAAGAGLAAVSGALGTVAVVHLLHSTLKLPLWACYGLVAGTVGVVGGEMLCTGLRQAKKVDLLPTQTVQEIKKDFSAATS